MLGRLCGEVFNDGSFTLDLCSDFLMAVAREASSCQVLLHVDRAPATMPSTIGKSDMVRLDHTDCVAAACQSGRQRLSTDASEQLQQLRAVVKRTSAHVQSMPC